MGSATSADLVIGIDAGTSGLRAGLFDADGQALGWGEAAYPTTYPRPGWAEQQPEDWWQALIGAVHACLQTSGVAAERIAGLAIDAPCSLLLVDAHGTPLTPALLWMDLRGASQAQRLTATNAAALAVCGGELPAEWPLPKAVWLWEQQPQVWQGAAWLVEQMGWLTHRLTGVWFTPLNSATVKWQYQTDPTTGRGAWPTELMATIGAEAVLAKVPQLVVPMGEVVGTLHRAAADALGLPIGLPVIASGIDAYAGAVGMGAFTSGTVALITGTSTCQIVQAPQAPFDPGIWGPFLGAVLPDQWAIEAGQASTGGTVRWLLDRFGRHQGDGTNRYQLADEQAAAVAPGSEGLTLLDFWAGSRTPIKDSGARGTIWGLTPAHDMGHLLRAVYEGTAYGNRRILEHFTAMGIPVTEIVACGGGTRSALWLQILTDVAGLPLALTREPDAVTLGSAICAAVGAKLYPDLPTASRHMVQRTTQIAPQVDLRETYAEGYARYLATHMALAPLFAQAHGG